MERVTLELLGDARKIAASLKGRVELALLAAPENTAPTLQDLGAFASERIHLVEHAALAHYSTSCYLQALQALVAALDPTMMIIAATAHGRDVAPRLAARLGFGYLPHCLTFRAVASGKLEVTRVTHGGRVHVQSVWPASDRAVLTMKPGVADAAQPLKTPAPPMIERHEMQIQPDRVRVIERLPADPATQDIREAQRIVSGGRGVGGAGGFGVIRDLAEALGASVAASRVAVDLGWIEHARQVGQTGKTVAPGLYVAAGISGASHHLMGMRASEKIVALNTDRQAPIFSISHFGVLGDLHQVLPRLTARIRKHKGN
jgi:electron transfer flavoprotein alpha subunit